MNLSIPKFRDWRETRDWKRVWRDPPGKMGMGACCCGKSSGSSGLPNISVCCCANSIPQTLTATISSACTKFNGLTATLTYTTTEDTTTCDFAGTPPYWKGVIPASSFGSCMKKADGTSPDMLIILACVTSPGPGCVWCVQLGVFDTGSGIGTNRCELTCVKNLGTPSCTLHTATCSPFLIVANGGNSGWALNTLNAGCCTNCGCTCNGSTTVCGDNSGCSAVTVTITE